MSEDPSDIWLTRCWKVGMEPADPIDEPTKPEPREEPAPTPQPSAPEPVFTGPVKTASAMIDRDTAAIYSKYRVELKFPPEIQDITGLFLNINSDLAVTPFNSEGAPSTHNLKVTYQDFSDIVGHGKFSGTIGAGNITIRLRSGALIKGTIKDGPRESASFIGSGTWLMP